MLSVPKLDDLSYDKLFQRARSRIPAYTGEWTDLNDHDPGITVLQTFAWLVDTLNYYIDATGEEHRLQYLRLLGLKPEQAAARCLAVISGSAKELAVARGAKLAAGEIIFEAEESYMGGANIMTALFQEIGGSFIDLTPFAGADGDYAALFTHDKDEQPTLYIGFDREIGKEIRFYADVFTHPARNPFTDEFTLSNFSWEYFDGGSWRRMPPREDGTCGFLKSGFLGFSAEGVTKRLEGHPVLPAAHYLRARLLRNEYDALPRIGKIYPNCVGTVQTNTYAQALEAEFDGGELVVDYHVRDTDLLCVAVEDGDGYSLWFEHNADNDSLCDVAAGKYPWQRVIRFDEKRFGKAPEKGQKILITITAADMYDTLRLGVTSGFARDSMEVDLANLHELRLAMVEQRYGRPYYRLWDECGEVCRATPVDRVFGLDRAAGVVTFGDGVKGVQPEAGQLVVAVTAKTSAQEAGNVRANRIDHFLDDEYSGISVYNPEDASGGKRPATSAELEREIEDNVYKIKRAVTARDYKEIAGATPGLMIDCVNVISSAEYARYYGGEHTPNTVLVAVKPYSGHDPRPLLSETYRRRIRENMERYRLLTTDIRILPAKYVGLEADGRVVLAKNTPELRDMVREKLTELAAPQDGDKFGVSLIYGRMFSRLEMLDGVEKVSDLSFTCHGEGAHKNEQGDIIVYPDAIAYLREINIEFV